MNRVPPSNNMHHIDFTSPLPYYHQLADILREEIDKGTWKTGELIPAEGALTETFGVSRSVTRKTLDVLEGEGRGLRIKGKGTLVTEPKFSQQSVDVAGRWFTPRSTPARLGKILSARKVSVGGHVGRLLGMSPRDDVWEIVLTHTVDDDEISLSQLFLRIAGTLSVSAPPEFRPGGPDIVHQLATRYGLELTTAQMDIEVIPAPASEAEILGLQEGDPLIQISSIESGKRLVGFVRTVIRPEQFFFAGEIHRAPQTIRDHSVSGFAAKMAD